MRDHWDRTCGGIEHCERCSDEDADKDQAFHRLVSSADRATDTQASEHE